MQGLHSLKWCSGCDNLFHTHFECRELRHEALAHHHLQLIVSVFSFSYFVGKQILNVVFPGSDGTSIFPLCWFTMFCATSRPSPVPFPIGLVVKKASNILSMISFGMPGPLSVIETRENSRSRSVFISTTLFGRPSMASMALSTRVVHTWFISLTRMLASGGS